jgi:hypothetical protein
MRTGTDTGYFQSRSPPDAWGEMEKEMEQRESDRSPTVIDTIKKTIDDLIQEIERQYYGGSHRGNFGHCPQRGN